ncbi:MAG: RNA polymerase sigma factor [Bacteroidetes bacterium]|nr:RNA polymerase sigma factor [Bacteroidota bacterium]
MTDKELITGIINRDNVATQFLVVNYHPKVIKTAYYFVHDMNDAEDLAQDVCVEILESARHFKGMSSLNTWIYRITVNKSLNFIRKNKRKQLFSQIENVFRKQDGYHAIEPQEPSFADTNTDNAERRKILERSINTLPENQRTAFVLNKYEDLSYKEIAEVMNVSLASVEQLLHRAKMNLQKKLIVHYSEYSKNKPNHELRKV